MSTLVEMIEKGPCLYKGQGASNAMIDEAEALLGVSFASEYRSYLQDFGFAEINGYELTGLGGVGSGDVVEITKKARNYSSGYKETWYTVEQTNIDGIFIWQDAAGFVYQTIIGGEPVMLAESLGEYVAQ